MSCTQVYEWFKCFKDGHESVESDEHSGRPLTSKSDCSVELVCAAVRENCRITIHELADDLNICFGSVQSILPDELGMRNVSAKFVPKVLAANLKDARMSIAQDLLECVKNDENFIMNMHLHAKQ